MNRNTANLWLGVMRILMIVAIPTPSFAQAVESLTAGTRIRVRTISPNEWRVGYVHSTDSSGISVTNPVSAESKSAAIYTPSILTIPHSSISRVEVSRGRGDRVGRVFVGALLGGLGGGLILGTTGYLATRCTCEESGIGVLAGPMFGVPIGIVLGAIIGFATPREVWEPVAFGGQTGR